MKKTIELLLRLEGLVLLDKGLRVAGSEGASLENLDERIQNLRRQVPGRVLSVYDKLAGQYADPLAALIDGVCQGCHEPVSAATTRRLGPQNLRLCEHCGRLLFLHDDAPDYVI